MDATNKQASPLEIALRKGGQAGIRNPHDATAVSLEHHPLTHPESSSIAKPARTTLIHSNIDTTADTRSV